METAIIKRVSKMVEDISTRSISSRDVRTLLNDLEKKYPQFLFVKTNLCDRCDSMKIEVWIKVKELTI